MPQMKPLLWLVQYIMVHVLFILFYILSAYKKSLDLSFPTAQHKMKFKKWVW